ncbi:MAG: HD domain-containing protein [Oscillospiraceae bacterium]|nr:HD domain-containing protein [Oscillospiraceae bacterium]
MSFTIPDDASAVIDALEKDGFEAYLVGGCVRDMLLGARPADWDVCTAATPDQVKLALDGYRVIETGVKHGTVTVISGGEHIEVTTFRTDGTYSDNRRPDSVTFVRDLNTDLARRDFTVNAIAYRPPGEIIDLFGGRRDLSSGIIRCVGVPETRFREDALRVMRALRFASAMGFTVDDATLRAALSCRELLKTVAAERVSEELGKLLTGKGAAEALAAGVRVVETVIPELSETVGFEQHNPYHDKDVWEHTLAAVAGAPRDLVVRLALLLHDIAKPRCYTSLNGVGHFYGHPAAGAETARKILKRLKFSSETVKTVSELIYHHDNRVRADEKNIKRWLGRLGERMLRLLVAVQRADTLGHSPYMRDGRLAELDAVSAMLDEMVARRPCVTLRDLAVNGDDLISAGVERGPAIGAALRSLLELVIDGELPNEKSALLSKVDEAHRRRASVE